MHRPKRKRGDRHRQKRDRPLKTTPKQKTPSVAAGAARSFGRIVAGTDVFSRKPISRRRAFGEAAGVGIGSAVIAGEVETARRLRNYVNNRHEITGAFVRHSGLVDMPKIGGIVRRAEVLGNPFDAMCVENITIKPTERDELVSLYKTSMERGKREVEQLMRGGMSRRKAIEQAFPVSSSDPQMVFEYGLRRIAHQHNLPMGPIEWYKPGEIDRLSKIQSEKVGEKVDLMVYSKSLAEQLEKVEAVNRQDQFSIIERNKRIKENIPEVIRLLKKHHPHLKKKKKLKLLYVMGIYHFQVAETSSSKIEFTHSLTDEHNLIIIPLGIYGNLLSEKPRRLSQREKAQLVVATNLEVHWRKLLQQGNRQEVNLLRKNISLLTMSDFNKLNQLTLNKGFEEKERILLEYLRNR